MKRKSKTRQAWETLLNAIHEHKNPTDKDRSAWEIVDQQTAMVRNLQDIGAYLDILQ